MEADHWLSGSASLERLQIAEYVYYALIAYSILGEAVGLSVPLVGIAGLAALAGFCVLRQDRSMEPLRFTLASPILCTVLFVGIQVVVHGESVMHSYVRSFVAWTFTLIVAQSLCNRPGFLRRFTLFAFAMGLCLLPFLDMEYTASGRAGLDRVVGLANPNDFAAWFGFCALAFIIRALSVQKFSVRWGSWLATVFCLFIIGLTVTRAPIAAVAVAAVIPFRERLKRGFLPIFTVVCLTAGALMFGVFDGAIEAYAERGLEDTGRLAVWPAVAQRITLSPFAGVGVSDVGTIAPGRPFLTTPHNGLLFMALASGLVPVIFFLAYWLVAFRGALLASYVRNRDAAYLLPLLVYSFLIMLELNQGYTKDWIVVSVAASLHNLRLYRVALRR